MTRCKEFYDKVERDGFDWCEKDKSTVSRINSYLKVVNELSDEGIEKKLTYGNFSENASRPLSKVEDPDTRGEVISLIAKSIQRGDQPSEADVKVWIDLASGIDPVTPRKPVPKEVDVSTIAKVTHVPEATVLPEIVTAKDLQEGIEPEAPAAPQEPPKVIIKTLPNPIGVPHIPPTDVKIAMTSGMWRAIHNAIVTGKVKADAKRDLDAWQVGTLRAMEAGVEAL
jgi:hypothetical protein